MKVMYVTFNIHYDICAFVLYVLMAYLFFYRKEMSSFQNRFYILMLFSSLIAVAFDACASFMINDKFWFPDSLTFFMNSLYLLFHNMGTYFLALYVFALTGRLKSHGRLFFVLFPLPLVIDVAMLVQNFVFKNIFYIDDGTFLVTPWYLFFVTFSMLIYSVVCLYLIATFHYRFSSFHISFLVLIIVGNIVFSILEYFYMGINVEMFARAVMLCILLFRIENESDIININTGVYNRSTFEEHSAQLLNSKRPYTVILLKLCNIRPLVSILGVDFINAVMSDIADYLATILVDRHSIYDCNHYTFALIIDEKHSFLVKDITVAVNEKFSKDWLYDNLSIPLSVVMGVVNIPLDLRSVDSLMKLIDNTEENYTERVSVIKDSHLKFLQREAMVAAAIEKALDEKTLQLYYQPIWDCRRKCVHGAEAFVRLRDESLDFIPSEEVISVAEKYGTIRKLGVFMMQELCAFMASPAFMEVGMDCMVANLSAVQCLQRDLPFLFKNIVDSHGLRTERIYFDIRETTTIMMTSSALHTIHNLHDMGFKLALDNYGTGNTDASSIFMMGFENIKIDRSILAKGESSDSALVFLYHTIQMLKEMGYDVAVEGVENQTQKDFVEKSGITFYQGYYFSKPLPKDEFLAFCRKIKTEESL